MIPLVGLRCHAFGPFQDDICRYLGPADHAQLQTLLTNRNPPRLRLSGGPGLCWSQRAAAPAGSSGSQRPPGPWSGVGKGASLTIVGTGSGATRPCPHPFRRSLGKGASSVMTHDDKRHGTTARFAALDVKSGMVSGECLPRHRAKAFPAFRAASTALASRRATCSSARQLRHPQDARGAGLAGKTPAPQAAFHADQRVMADHGRTLLCRNHATADRQGRLPQRRRSGSRHLRLPWAAQHQAKALCLDQIRRTYPHPRTPCAGQTR